MSYEHLSDNYRTFLTLDYGFVEDTLGVLRGFVEQGLIF